MMFLSTAAAEYMFMGVSVAIAFVGIGLAYALYRKGPSEEAASWAKRLGLLHALSKGKYFVDELYKGLIIAPLYRFSQFLWLGIDQTVIDELGVRGVAGTVSVVGDGVRVSHNGSLRRYLVMLLLGATVVLGSVYCNPRVSQIGPNVLNPTDPGGLRPQQGGVPVDWNGWWYRDADPPTRRAPARPAGGQRPGAEPAPPTGPEGRGAQGGVR